MGVLRFLLAFSVFNAHAALPLGFSIVAGSTAVHCFFVISGFYMALVLSEKYSPAGATYFNFVSSRLLRLAPSYLIVLILTISLAVLAAGAGLPGLPPFAAMERVTEAGAGVFFHALNVLSQISLLGQDVYSFLGWAPADGLRFTPALKEGSDGLYNLLIVPPAWSLSVEIYFYLLAPWLVRLRTPVIFALIGVSFLCRAVLASSMGWLGDPWSYRFFPSELAFFLTGVLAYRAQSAPGSRTIAWTLALVLLGSLLGLAETLALWQPEMPIQRWARIPLFAALAVGMATLFSLTKNWRLDRQIGELSYPLYISHFLVIWTAGYFFADLSTAPARMALIVAAMLAALALRVWVDVPVDRFRQTRFAKRASPAVKSTTAAQQARANKHSDGLSSPAGQ